MSGGDDPRISFLDGILPAAQHELVRMLAQTQMVITAADPTLKSAAGQMIIYQLATLVSRLFDNVVVEGDEQIESAPALRMLSGSFVTGLRRLCTTFRPMTPEPPAATVRIRVGEGTEDADLYVGATAWSASISFQTPQPVRPSSWPMGPLAAGTLAASEVFKLVFAERIPRAVTGLDYRLSLLTYDQSAHTSPLPTPLQPIDLVLFGGGSIGTSFAQALLFAEPLRGSITVVDNGRFDRKNPYKYALLDWETAEVGPYKAPWLARQMTRYSGGRLRTAAMVGTAEQYVASLEHSYRIPLAISAVDTIEARFEIQDTLPKQIINAGIMGTTAEVSVHAFGTGPCLACIGLESELESWQAIPIADALGLDVDRVHHLIRGNIPMKPDDITRLRTAGRLQGTLRDTLDTFLGQPLLSLWNRAAYGEVSLSIAASGSPPRVSTAFVSAFAGVLLLAELVKVVDPALSDYVVDNSYRQEMLGIPASNLFRYQRDPRGWCLCHSSFRLAMYKEKYGIA